MKRCKIIDISPKYTALEFFSGIGLARAGMDRVGVKTIWANDIDEVKCTLYKAQWGDKDLVCKNVFDVKAAEVPTADVAWASSPCTDLSLAGKREGLINGRESSAFFGFVNVIEAMKDRKPRAIILENVCGLASSHDGADFRIVVEEFNRLGYSVDAFEINARRWLPQSRPRMFVVGIQNPRADTNASIDSSLRPDKLAWIHSDKTLETHVTPLGPIPEIKTTGLTQLVDKLNDADSRWWDSDRINSFISSLNDTQRRRFDNLVSGSKIVARTAYRRTRAGKPVWEIREDDIAGCLRTARGGSSKQAVVFMGNGTVRARWMTGSEYAKLQGARKFKIKGFRDSQVQYAFGDAVAVPAVSWLVREAVIPYLHKMPEEVRHLGTARQAN